MMIIHLPWWKQIIIGFCVAFGGAIGWVLGIQAALAIIALIEMF